MANRKAGKDEEPKYEPPNLIAPRQEAEEKIESQITKGTEILNFAIRGQEDLEEARNSRKRWEAFNIELLQRLFDNPSIAKEFGARVRYSMIVRDYSQIVSDFFEDTRTLINRLESIKGRLELIPEINTISAVQPDATDSITNSNRVFIVHGHDEASKQATARFLEKLDLEPIILHEQPNSGRTIIEKFESYSDVSFAIVLLTPDDHIFDPESETVTAKRARQNVILELGYFIGKLGRSRVAALYSTGTEIPSDINGVLYIPIDSTESWKLLVARELKEAGFRIDLNAAI